MKIGKLTIKNPLSWESKEDIPQLHTMPLTTGFAPIDERKKIKPGRESEDPADVLSSTDKYTPIQPDFALEWLPILENLAVSNPDVGFAIDNIVQLGNTPWEVVFRDDVNNKIKKEVLKLIEDHKDTWYNYSEGLNSFRSDVLAQAAINGAMSIEIVPNAKLDNINLVRVAPKKIRFLYNKKTGMYEPFQVVQNPVKVTANIYGLKSLNTIKYKYIAWRRIHEGPYPAPPFLNAIRTLDIQNDIVTNLKFVIEKLGMLGFLSAKVTPPEKESGESKTAYFNRCLTFLEQKVYPQLQKNLKNGMVVGYKNSHEFDMQPSSANPAGAQNIVKIVELMLFAGLKQDPNMLGRNYSVSETFGRVILAKMTNQVKEYQNMLNALMKDIIQMFLLLRGYDPKIVMGVISEPAMLKDKVQEENARSTDIDNVFKLRDNGIIDQQQAANELGYEKPADKNFKKIEPIDPANPKDKNDDPDNLNDNNTDDKKEEETQNEIKRISAKCSIDVPEYNYDTLGCDGTKMTFIKNSNFGDKQMNNFAKTYSGKVYEQYAKFAAKAINSAVKEVQRLNELSPLQTFQENVYLAILQDWETYFKDKLDPITEKNVQAIYSHYRKDDSVFPKGKGFKKGKSSFEIEIPEPVFNIDDFRAIDYAAQSDSMYLGKFITDENTKKKIYNYLEERYIDGELAIGNDQKAIAEFKSKFSNIFEFESYKIRRIIDTSVNNLRNDANVQYINQAELTQYEVVEIGDDRTCIYCNHMNGMVMDVSNAVNKINSKLNMSPENVSNVSPFATTVKPDDFTKMSADDLQQAGFSTPAYHASCRGRIVAK